MPHFVINILYYTNDIKLNVLNINIDSWGDGASQVSNLTARVHGTANSHSSPKNDFEISNTSIYVPWCKNTEKLTSALALNDLLGT